MSDEVIVSLIGNITVLASVIVGRWLSSRENAVTSKQVNDTHAIVNSQRDAMMTEIKYLQSEIQKLTMKPIKP